MIPKHFFNKTFRQDYWIFMGWDKASYLKYCKEVWDVDDDKSISYGECFKLDDHDQAIIIWVQDATRGDLISHECLHATNYTLDAIGAIASFKNDEVQAYMIQELYRECCGAIAI